jgi:hypothetical protein
MVSLIIDEAPANRLQAIAAREDRPIQDVLHRIVEQYETTILTEHTAEERAAALERFIGSIPDDITDLSMTVRETMAEIYRRKYDGTD